MTKVATVKEWCSHCETEVELPEVFTKHVCPNCKIEIKPCAQCETMDCGNCPLGWDSVAPLFQRRKANDKEI